MRSRAQAKRYYKHHKQSEFRRMHLHMVSNADGVRVKKYLEPDELKADRRTQDHTAHGLIKITIKAAD